jgi:hypothetical protein
MAHGLDHISTPFAPMNPIDARSRSKVSGLKSGGQKASRGTRALVSVGRASGARGGNEEESNRGSECGGDGDDTGRFQSTRKQMTERTKEGREGTQCQHGDH